MDKTMNGLKNKFKTEELKIFETDYCIWSLKPHQVILGYGILALKREYHTFRALNSKK